MGRVVANARGRQSKAAAIADSLLDTMDYLYPVDLFQIFVVRWDLFGPVLGGTHQVWQDRGGAVTRARNEVVHIRPIPGGVRLPAQNAAVAIVGHVEATAGAATLHR